MKIVLRTCISVIALFFCLNSLFAQPNQASDKYKRIDTTITMRDGIKLFTVIYIPKQTTEKLPFLMLRTPYWVKGYPSPEKQEYVKDMA